MKSLYSASSQSILTHSRNFAQEPDKTPFEATEKVKTAKMLPVLPSAKSSRFIQKLNQNQNQN